MRMRVLSRSFVRTLASDSNADLSAAKLSIVQNKSPKPLVPLPKLVFGQSFTDHMLTIDWSATQGIYFL